jgi:hypothetical protein
MATLWLLYNNCTGAILRLNMDNIGREVLLEGDEIR